MKRTVMPKKIAIQWIIDTKATSPFTRNFVEWMYDNGFEILVTSDDKMNKKLGKELDDYYGKQPGVRTEW